RVKALLRRTQKASAGARIVCGTLILDKETYKVTADGQEVTLTHREFELLEFLLENRNIVLSREKILDRIWGYTSDVETRTLDVHIRSLRQKLATSGNCIETVRGIGYRIEG
ncbi:MAG: response regulator transcription factor, partial [Peptococcaceae bacterium]|nr:response regulator transcription factor [Peptococcaceae bacterium]